ncbi:MAG: PLP-dependent cysteine synthase family protein [Candidatus Thorarchaeota archaeon]
MPLNWDKYKQIQDNIFDLIGLTPLFRLPKISEKTGANILGKIEWYSPTGSLKDRIYFTMIHEAIKRGELKPGMEILESSTGNAGIACAFVGRMLDYPVTIVMPEGMSQERRKLMAAYGANLIFTPGGESDVDLCLAKVKELKETNPGKYWEPAQFSNPDNILAHYETTGKEIWEQTDGVIDAFIASQGTGGTITGVGQYLRKHKPQIMLYAIEPTEAPLLAHRRWGSHRIEGIGDGFVPENLDLSILNGIITTTSDEALEMAQWLSREEGLFCGISSGSNIAAALKLLKKHPELKTIVTMINDSGQRYFSTPLCGEPKHLDIPDREHPMDKRTIEELDKYQHSWEIIE